MFYNLTGEAVPHLPPLTARPWCQYKLTKNCLQTLIYHINVAYDQRSKVVSGATRSGSNPKPI